MDPDLFHVDWSGLRGATTILVGRVKWLLGGRNNDRLGDCDGMEYRSWIFEILLNCWMCADRRFFLIRMGWTKR